MFRGRENEHPEIGMNLLRLVAEALVDDAALESPPNFESRRMLSMILAPLSNSNVREQKTNQNRERVRA